MRSLDKFRGCLIGGAAGDALGYEVEFLREPELSEKFGENGITEYVFHNGKALVSDDTQMTLFTAGAFLFNSEEEFPEGYMRLCYQDWYRTQTENFPLRDRQTHSFLMNFAELFSRRAPGVTCMNAVRDGAYGTVSEPVNNSKGCGGVMRVAPIGLYYTDKNVNDLNIALYGAKAAAMTHGHELGYIPAAALAHIIWSLSSGETSVRKAVNDSVEAVKKIFPDAKNMKYFTELTEKAIELADKDISDSAALKQLGEGWVAEETLAVAVYCAVKYSDNFDKAITVSVNHSGDSDSTGAVTGNILGTLCGYEAIPQKYKENLELHDLILKTADELFEK